MEPFFADDALEHGLVLLLRIVRLAPLTIAEATIKIVIIGIYVVLWAETRLAQNAWLGTFGVGELLCDSSEPSGTVGFLLPIQVGRATVAAKLALVEELDQLMFGVARYTTSCAHAATAARLASIDGLSNVASLVRARVKLEWNRLVRLRFKLGLLSDQIGRGESNFIFAQVWCRQRGIWKLSSCRWR